MALNIYENNEKTKNLTQNDSIFYIFEIDIKYNDQTSTKLRRIKNNKYGDIIYNDYMIKNNISKIKFTIFNINDPLNNIIIKKKFNNIINDFLLLNNDEVLFQLLEQENNTIICKYRFLN